MDKEKYGTTEEVAEYLHKTPGAVRNLVKRNNLRTERWGRAHMIEWESVREYLAKVETGEIKGGWKKGRPRPKKTEDQS